jgi:hypothetical protein
VWLTFSVAGVRIRLTTERWAHIIAHHPELRRQTLKVLETVRDPDRVLQGDFGEKLAVRSYRKTPVSSKRLVVAYREVSLAGGFIITAYFASRAPVWRETLWNR